MTMMVTSPTAPSAVAAGKCSCVATTTVVGQYNDIYMGESWAWQPADAPLVARTGLWISYEQKK